MAKTVIGLFDSAAQANNVVQDLVNAGFSRDDLGIVANNTTGEYNTYLNSDYSTAVDTTSAAESGAGAGATAGTVIGGGLGLLAGIGALAIPGFGPIVAAGWLVSTITGAGIGAALGGLVGALTGLGVPQEDAEYYNEGVRRGGTLVTVRTSDDQADQAASILSGHGAVNIDERADTYRSTGYAGYDENAQPYTADQINTFRSSYAPAATATVPATNLSDTNTNAATNYDTTPASNVNATANPNYNAAVQQNAYNARVHHFEDDRSMANSTYPSSGPGLAQNVENAAHVAGQRTANAVESTEGNIPGIQTGGRAVDGSGAPDTRGITEKVADTVTGNRIDDKTGRPV